MKAIMNYSAGEQKKHLLWSVFADDEAELSRYRIHEFKVCDCFADWTICFQNENKNTVFSEELIKDFFDGIPIDMVDCDIFSIFGKVTIVCCRIALYHWKMFSMINFLTNVWVMTLTAVVRTFLRKNYSLHIFVQIVNLIL